MFTAYLRTNSSSNAVLNKATEYVGQLKKLPLEDFWSLRWRTVTERGGSIEGDHDSG